MSVRDRSGLTNPHERLPDIELPAASGDVTTRVRSTGRTSRVLLLLHGAECEACRAYLARLAEHRMELDGWDARPLVVVPSVPDPTTSETEADGEGEGDPALRSPSFAVAVDSGGRLASALAVSLPALVVADQWGEIHDVEEAGNEHRFLAPDEVVAWARYLAVQCPECEGEAL